MSGSLVLSLDFEALWGSIGSKDSTDFPKRLDYLYENFPVLLRLIEKYDIHCTWAIVSSMLLNDVGEFRQAGLGDYYYDEYKLSLKSFVECADKRYLFFGGKIRDITSVAGQEIASHTATHIYYSSESLSEKTKIDELIVSKRMLSNYFKTEVDSIVLPRNQTSNVSASVLKESGYSILRTNNVLKPFASSFLNKVINYFNAYLPLSKNTVYDHIEKKDGIYFIPASLFVRMKGKKDLFFLFMRLLRIKKLMLYSAKHNKICHLWFHPHNIGKYKKKNFMFLEKIFKYYKKLQKKYNMRTLNMKETIESE